MSNGNNTPCAFSGKAIPRARKLCLKIKDVHTLKLKVSLPDFNIDLRVPIPDIFWQKRSAIAIR